MTMKAVRGGGQKFVSPSSKASVDPGDSDDLDISGEVVMVLFPDETWAEVLRIGKEMDAGAPEVISCALELLNKNLEEKRGT